MRVTVIVSLIVLAMASVASAELCRIGTDDFELPGESSVSWQIDHPPYDFLGHWQSVWLGMPWEEGAKGTVPITVVSGQESAIPVTSAGDEIDLQWYIFLDRQRYRFLDVTQYDLLTGWRDWRRRRWAWPDAFTPPLPRRCVCGNARPIPEPLPAILLALGAAIALPKRRSVARR